MFLIAWRWRRWPYFECQPYQAPSRLDIHFSRTSFLNEACLTFPKHVQRSVKFLHSGETFSPEGEQKYSQGIIPTSTILRLHLIQILTPPTLRSIRMSPPIIPRLLRIRTKRPLPRHPVRNTLIPPDRRDKPLRRLVPLHPRHQRQQRIMLRIPETRYRVRASAQSTRLIRASEIPRRVDV